jgi:hypothetical protein
MRMGMEMAYSSLAGVIEAEEEQFGVLVGQSKAGQHVPDCALSVVLS